MLMGGIALATPYLSFRDLWTARTMDGDGDGGPASAYSATESAAEDTRHA